MGWGAATKLAKQSGGGKFLRLEDGDRCQVVVMSEPHVKYVIWDQEQGKSVQVAPGQGKPRFFLSVYNVGQKAPQILEMSGRVFEDVSKELEGAGYESILTIKRSGTGKDTRYAILASGQPDAALRAALEVEADPFDLVDEVGAEPVPEPGADAAPSDVPF